MSLSSIAVVLLLLCGAQHGGAQHNNFYGTVMTFYPKDINADGTRTVVLRYKTAFTSCTDSDTWECYVSGLGLCGSETLLEVNTVQSTTEWCQREGIMTRLVQNNDFFFMVLRGGNWINNTDNIASWFAATSVNLRTRSDTGKANRTPQTTIIPSLRVPSNCERNFNLLTFDPDGDQVKCNVDGPTNITSFLTMSTNCTLSFAATNTSSEGTYIVQLTMNDYPNQNVTLTHRGGSQSISTTTKLLSSVPLQFVVKVDGAVPSCTEGRYLPRFLPPTPANRAQLYTPVGDTLEITINTEATNSTVSELLFSGPHNMILTGSAQGQFILRWTPSQSEDGEHHPVCFVAQANGVDTYQSELRCVIVIVQQNFYGTVMTYDTKDTYANGSMTVVLHYKTTFTSCSGSDTWQCYPGYDCGNETLLEVNTVQSTTEWCQREGIMTRLVPNNIKFYMYLQGGNWIHNRNNIEGWFAATLVNLRTRSDTGKANRSPQTTIIPSLRVPSNCERNFNLLTFDPDGDQVKCNVDGFTSFLNISTNCILSFAATNSSNEGPYVVTLTMSDHPNQSITLTRPSGSQQSITTSNTISYINLQFVVKVDGAVPSCTEGRYLPRFLPPTPANRAHLYTPVGDTLEITINTEATNSTVSELLFSGPHNMNLTGSAQGQFILRWTPSQSEDGEHHPVCFVAQANGVDTYQSELRCVIVSVSNEATTTTPTTIQPIQQNNFYGTVMTYDTKDTYANGSMTVVLRYKTAFTSCSGSDTWQCYPGYDCGNETLLEVNTVQSTTEWFQREGIMTRLVPNNNKFYMYLQGGNWIHNRNNIVGWFAATLVNFRTRSDTGKANRSPHTTIIPSLRVPSNCERNFNLLTFDPDGDQVKCNVDGFTSFLNISTNCILSFAATNSSNEGPYVVTLTMSDHPNQSITLTRPSGSQQSITTSNTISYINLQFVVKVDGAVPSCTEGRYLPRFLPPTPANRAQLYSPVGDTLEITINTEATNSTVSELLFSGPHNMNLTGSAQGQFILRWTPSQSEDGEHHPVCFVAQANGVDTYQSELRCVIVSVSHETTTTTTIQPSSTTQHTTMPTAPATTPMTPPTTETTTPPTITTTPPTITTTPPPTTTETTTPFITTTLPPTTTETTTPPIITTTLPPTTTETTTPPIITTTLPPTTTETTTPPTITTTLPPTTTETTTPPTITTTLPPTTTETTTPPFITTTLPPTTTETTTPPIITTTLPPTTTETTTPPFITTTLPPTTTETTTLPIITTTLPPTTTETTTPPFITTTLPPTTTETTTPPIITTTLPPTTTETTTPPIITTTLPPTTTETTTPPIITTTLPPTTTTTTPPIITTTLPPTTTETTTPPIITTTLPPTTTETTTPRIITATLPPTTTETTAPPTSTSPKPTTTVTSPPRKTVTIVLPTAEVLISYTPGSGSGGTTGLRMRISSKTPLTKEDIRTIVLPKLKEELVKHGLPADIILKLINVQQKE